MSYCGNKQEEGCCRLRVEHREKGPVRPEKREQNGETERPIACRSGEPLKDGSYCLLEEEGREFGWESLRCASFRCLFQTSTSEGQG